MEQRTSGQVPASGVHGIFDGVLYPLRFHQGGWAFRTDRPAAGFTADGTVFVRMIAVDDHVECFSFRHRGAYRGLDVAVLPLPGGDLELVSTDAAATEQGFTAHELRRGGTDWRTTVRTGDPELSVTSVRRPLPAPWADNPEEVLPPRGDGDQTSTSPGAGPDGPVRGPSPSAPREDGLSAQSGSAGYRPVRQSDGPPSWGDLTHALAATFRDVSDRVFLIVMSASDPRRYVQLAGGPTLLHAEAPGADVVADADEDALHAADWDPPGPAQPSWSSELDRTADATELTALAARCVKALRHAYGLSGPSAMVYRAWRDPETMLPGETWSAERLETYDRGSASLALPTLGLPSR